MKRAQEKFSDNISLIILELFHISAKFSFTLNKIVLGIQQNKHSVGVASKVADPFKVWILRN